MKSLRVNFYGDARLVVNGPVTGRRYEYLPTTAGRMEVDDRDAPEMLKIQTRKGCGCSRDASDAPTTGPLFEL